MADLSLKARDVCATFFGMTAKDTLRSHAPHKMLTSIRPEMDELVAAGIITEEPFNRYGSLLFTGSEAARAIGHARRVERLTELGLINGVSSPSPLAEKR